MMEILGKKFFTVEELATLMGYHRQTIYRLIKQRKIKAKKIFGRYYLEFSYVKKILGVESDLQG